MFKRLFWLSTGLTIGFGSSVWVTRALRRAVARVMPQRLTHDAVAGARSVSTELKAALDEGREAMRQREADLRAEIGRRSALRAQSD